MHIVKPFKNVLSDVRGNSISYYAKVLSTNAPDEALDEYIEQAYSANAEVKIEALKRKYISKIDNNTDYPVGSKNWIDAGALNSYRSVDDYLFTQTTATTDLVQEIDTSMANTISLMNITNVNELLIELIDLNTNEVVKEELVSLRDYGVTNFYDYLFKPFKNKKRLVKNIEWLPSSKVRITLYYTGVELGLGAVFCGTKEDTGISLYGATLGQKNYSVIDTDEWGYTKVVQRGVADTLDAKVLVQQNEIDTALKTFEDVRGTLSLFVLDARDRGVEKANVFGFCQKVSIPLEKSASEYSISIIGVI